MNSENAELKEDDRSHFSQPLFFGTEPDEQSPPPVSKLIGLVIRDHKRFHLVCFGFAKPSGTAEVPE